MLTRQQAAPVQPTPLDLAFPMATFAADFSEPSCDILQKKRLHGLPAGHLYHNLFGTRQRLA